MPCRSLGMLNTPGDMSAKPLGKGRGQHGRQRWLAKTSADMFCQAVWATYFARKSETQPRHNPDTSQTQARHPKEESDTSQTQARHHPDTTPTQTPQGKVRHNPDTSQTPPRHHPDTTQRQPRYNPDTTQTPQGKVRHNPDTTQTPQGKARQVRHNPETPGKSEAQPKHPLVCGGKSEIRRLHARLRSRSHSQHTWPLRHIRRQVIGPIAHTPSLSLSPVVDLGRVWWARGKVWSLEVKQTGHTMPV